MNRLASSTSPYLLQHKDNPVDWWEWTDEAFAEARRRDVPVLLSVGYAACHWCHVMAHESFEDEAVAAVMNEHFVCIKVDREERPDIDAVYMTATTALTGQGGWPMTCLLDHDGAPFFAGTYFPRPQFLRLLEAIDQAWRNDRAAVRKAGQQVVEALAQADLPDSAAAALPGPAELDRAVGALAGMFDNTHGGFGAAPKFPPSMVLEFLLRYPEPTAQAMADRTFEAMARSGMYDQLGGGFARYSTDQAWVVPHFEKMLYDNALLLRGYLHWWRRTDSPLAERIARETAEFLLRDLRTDEGGFASALDADTDGVEGLTYVWTPTQLREVLGEDATTAAELFAVTEAGTFEAGASTLRLPRDPVTSEPFASIRARLFAARAERPQPARDDKVVTSWNGLTIAALAEAGVLLGRPEYLSAAERCAQLLLDLHWRDGRLRRTSRGGRAGEAAGVADDYGALADGLLLLHQATGRTRWLTAAGQLLEVALEVFGDGVGGFYDTASDAERLVRRPRDPADNATPSGASTLATALLSYASLTGSGRHRDAAEAALRQVAGLAADQPRFFGWWLALAVALLDGPVQVAIAGEPTTAEEAGTLTALAWRARPPGAVVVAGEPDEADVPLLAGRGVVAGRPAAYVCRGMVCDLPVTTADELAGALSR